MQESSSSVITFKACLEALSQWEPEFFILENVDLAEDEDGNFDLIVQALQCAGSGYNVRVFKLISTDYGLPTRRIRLYFGGFHRQKQPQASFEVVEKLLALFRLKSQKPAARLLSYASFDLFVL